jgi:hypothetical protein
MGCLSDQTPKTFSSRRDAKAQRKPKGRFMNALSCKTDFDFAFSAQLTIFGFDLLCAFASLRETGFGFVAC